VFKKVDKVEQAYLKAGLFGFQGSGKTRTATELAFGLHRHIKSAKGVVFIDTETGSDFMIPRFKEAGIELHVDKTRAFADLLRDLEEAPKVADIVIIDSITHFWREWVAAYKLKNRRRFIKIQDWGPLKEEWSRYSTLYVNSKLHIIMCGRAGNVFEDVVEGEDADDNGVRKQDWKAVKVGTKMAAETETGYEPSLLIEMTKEFIHDGGKYIRRANVIKERFGVIDSKSFAFSAEDKPGFVFECFRPHIDLLNLGGDHRGFDAERTSASLLNDEGQTRAAERARIKDVALEEIEGLFGRYLPGQDAKSKKLKLEVFQATCGTTSWKAITSMDADRTRQARYEIERLLKRIEANAEMLTDPNEFPAWLEDTLMTIRQEDAESRPN
jgi:hypothetical protein